MFTPGTQGSTAMANYIRAKSKVACTFRQIPLQGQIREFLRTPKIFYKVRFISLLQILFLERKPKYTGTPVSLKRPSVTSAEPVWRRKMVSSSKKFGIEDDEE